jgi:hypothetical protein
MFGTTPLTTPFNGYGNVYELQPSNGGWTQSLLYSFTGLNRNFLFDLEKGTIVHLFPAFATP